MRPTAVLLLLAAVARAGDVEERVAEIVASLTRQEKLELMNGVGWDQWDIRDGYYVGNLNGAPAKGLPAFKMHDAGQGFRDETNKKPVCCDTHISSIIHASTCPLPCASPRRPHVHAHAHQRGVEHI